MSRVQEGFPEDFPLGVPPNDAEDAHGEAYRLVRNDPPISDDFLGYYVEKKINGSQRPGDYGTSMYRTQCDIKVMRKMYKPQREKKIAKGELKAVHGKISKVNSKNHFELWLREKTGIEKNFSVVE